MNFPILQKYIESENFAQKLTLTPAKNAGPEIRIKRFRFDIHYLSCYLNLSFTLSDMPDQPRSQGLRGETLTKTLVKFVLSFQNFGEKISCAVRHNRIQLYCSTVVSHFNAIFFPKFWNDKMNFTRVIVTVSPRRPWDQG